MKPSILTEEKVKQLIELREGLKGTGPFDIECTGEVEITTRRLYYLQRLIGLGQVLATEWLEQRKEIETLREQLTGKDTAIQLYRDMLQKIGGLKNVE